jgi:hypothetical protein
MFALCVFDLLIVSTVFFIIFELISIFVIINYLIFMINSCHIVVFDRRVDRLLALH